VSLCRSVLLIDVCVRKFLVFCGALQRVRDGMIFTHVYVEAKWLERQDISGLEIYPRVYVKND